MNLIRFLFLFLMLFFFLILIIAFFLPKKIEITEQIKIQADAKTIFPYINDLKKWQEWSVWNKDYYQKSASYFQFFYYASNFYQSNQENFLTNNLPSSLLVESNSIVEEVLITEIVKRISNRSVQLITKPWGEQDKKNYAFSSIILKKNRDDNLSTIVQWSFTNHYLTYRRNLLDRYWIWFYTLGLRRSYYNSLLSLKEKIETRE